MSTQEKRTQLAAMLRRFATELERGETVAIFVAYENATQYDYGWHTSPQTSGAHLIGLTEICLQALKHECMSALVRSQVMRGSGVLQ